MAHGPDLRGIEIARKLERDRGARRLAVALEQAPLRDDEMNARRLHPPDRADGAGEFAFERAQMVDVLDEAGRGEGIALVEDLVADAAAGRDALAGEVEPQARHVGLRHQHRLPVAAQFVFDAACVEILEDGADILAAKLREQHAHRRLRHFEHDEAEEADEHQRDGQHGCQARRSEFGKLLDQAVHAAIRPTESQGRRTCSDPLGKFFPAHG